MTLFFLFNFVTVTRKSLGSAVVDVKAIILRSTHPVTVKLTSGERYDTVHPLCNHRCTPLYIIVVWRAPTYQATISKGTTSYLIVEFFSVPPGTWWWWVLPQKLRHRMHTGNPLLRLLHISHHLICSKTTFYDHPGKTVRGWDVVKVSCTPPTTFLVSSISLFGYKCSTGL